MSKLELNLSIDVDSIIQAIGDSVVLEDNDLIFSKLSKVAAGKAQLKEVEEAFSKLEASVKQAINDKARALYGPEWTAIAGTGYKITRSQTGPTYEINGEPEPKFVKLSPNSDEVDKYAKETGKLPTGISLNTTRGEQIRIAVNENN